jgi:hypothetical protein
MFFAAQTNLLGTYRGQWEVGPPEEGQRLEISLSMADGTFHEIRIPPGSLTEDGQLIVRFLNQSDSALLFPLENGFEVLYREGGFAMNFARGLGVLWSWMGLLAALGLASASLLSFPVASFFSLSLLVVALSSGTLAGVVEDGTVTALNHETGQGGAWIDVVLIPVFRGILGVVNFVEAFAPVDRLSAGRSITWGDLGLAWFQVVAVLGGVCAAAGITCLSRRELALPSGGT